MFSSKSTKDNVKGNSNKDTVVAIDIGTHKVRLLAGKKVDGQQAKAIYYGEKESRGIVSGSVCDLSRISECLSALVQDYEQKTQSALTHCNIGISGRHIDSRNETGSSVVASGIVTQQDKNKAIELARAVKIKEGNHIIHVIPQNYEVENNEAITNPIDLHAMRLGVNVHLISCSIDQENNFRTAIQKLSPNVEIDNVIYSGLAAADAVLTDAQKELGVCLIDFGEGTVDVCVYDKKKLIISFSLDRGGQRITEAIASEFHIPTQYAQYIKEQYGVAYREFLTPEDQLKQYRINASFTEGIDNNILVERGRLADVIQASVMDIFQSICSNIEKYTRYRSDYLQLSAGFVITGGGALLQGIETLAARGLNPSDNSGLVGVKIGTPIGYETHESLSSPEMAVPIGLMNYSPIVDEDNQGDEVVPKTKVGSMFKGIVDWFKKEF